MPKNKMNRREFIRAGGQTATVALAGKIVLLEAPARAASPHVVSPSDRVRFASIGTGVRGCQIMSAALRSPGTEIVATCDLWDGRLIAAQEVAQKQLPTTKDYRAILDRKDVDAVLVATPDHWHSKIVEDACAAGKDVYCEKPMTHKVEQGFSIIAAMQRHNRIVQVGSQRRSSVVYEKARQLYASGALGQVTAIEAWIDRNDASGAWVYPIAPGANEQTIDWNQFLGSAPKRPFDPVRFFRWRCFQDYGEGLPGDLYVHLLTGILTITGVRTPPQRAHASGGLFRWKDGRDQPDLIWTLYDYPDFRVALRCNLNNESANDITRVFGTHGTLTINGDTLTFAPQDTREKPEGYSIGGWPKALREEYLNQWPQAHPQAGAEQNKEAETFKAPAGYDEEMDHMNNFLDSVRSRKPAAEDPFFGNATAIACHMANYSYFNKTVAVWNEAARSIGRS